MGVCFLVTLILVNELLCGTEELSDNELDLENLLKVSVRT
jgi:hypothetical protein